MNIFHNLNVKWKIILPYTIMIFLIVGFIQLWYFASEIDRLKAQQSEKMEILIQSLAEASSNPLAVREYDRLQELLVHLKTLDSDIQRVTLVNKEGRCLASTFMTLRGQTLSLEKPAKARMLPSGVMEIELAGGNADYELRYPVRLFNIVMGELRISVSTMRIYDSFREFILISVLIGAAAVMFGIIVLNLIIRVGINKPVQELTRMSRQITSGDLDARIEYVSEDELGELAGTFNSMTSRLKETLKGLEQQITERKLAEAELKVSEEMVKRLLNSTAEAIYGVDTDGKCTFVNPSCLNLLGYENEEALLGRNIHHLIHHTRPDGTVYPEEECSMYRAYRKGVGMHGDDEVLWRADGSSFYVEYWSYPIRDGEKVLGAVVTFMDITGRRQLEEQLRHAQKMEAVGQLAGGVAHEFNNILTAIINNVYLVQRKTKEDDPARDNLAKVLKLSDNAARIAGELLAFSRKQLVDLSPLKLNDVVKGAERLLKNFISEDIDIRVLMSDREATIMADRHQIEQVIINLATNARDAMPGGGSLTIETGIREMDDQFVRTHGFGSPGTYALLSVTDTGEGVKGDIKQKIFEPFFTTKEVGKGTGLGLSIVYGIITQHNGHINVYSEPGEGTTFNIYLPEIKSAVPAEKAAVPFASAGKAETILVAEDEAAVRDSIRSVLEESGYRVIEAVDGKDAVDQFTYHAADIDLVIMDVIMPKMNGKEAYEEIRKISPGIKAIFTSGYTSDIIRTKKIIEGDLVFVSKPIFPDKLLLKIREVLEG